MHLKKVIFTSAILGGVSALVIPANHSLSTTGVSSARLSTPSLGVRHAGVGDAAGDGKGYVGVGMRTLVQPIPGVPGFHDPLDPNIVNEYRNIGHRILDQMMSDTVAVVPQTRTTKIQLRKSGWDLQRQHITDEQPPQILAGLLGVSGLVYDRADDGSARLPNPIDLEQSQWEDVHMVHTGTEGDYHALVYKQSEAVVLLDCKVDWPQGQAVAQSTLPRIRDWADIAEYVMRPAKRRGPAPPKWFYIKQTRAEEDTRKLVVGLLKRYGVQDLPAWPGVTIPIGSYYFDALLALRDIKPVVDYLLRHRGGEGAGFGISAITSITIFDSGETQNLDFDDKVPNFLIHAQRKTAQLIAARNKNDAFENGNGRGAIPLHPASGRMPRWPEALTPYPISTDGQTASNAPGGPPGGGPPAKRPPPSSGGSAPKKPAGSSNSGSIQGSSKNPHAGQQHRGQQ